METFLLKASQLIAALALLVIIHEFGHYIFARMFGIRVEKFYLFFDPWFSIFKWKPKEVEKLNPDGSLKTTWRDTEYGIGWLPLGGYVKIAGMIDESMDKEQMAQPEQPWEFRAKPAYQRLLIMVGGVLFNFILAIAIYAGIVYTWGEQYLPYRNATAGMMYSASVQTSFHGSYISTLLMVFPSAREERSTTSSASVSAGTPFTHSFFQVLVVSRHHDMMCSSPARV